MELLLFGIVIVVIAVAVYGNMREKDDKMEEQRIEDEEAQKQWEKEQAEKAKKQCELERWKTSPLTKEITDIIVNNNSLPYEIHIEEKNISLIFENKTIPYAFLPHGFPNMLTDDQNNFALILNELLGYLYESTPVGKIFPYTNSDGSTTHDFIQTGMILSLKPTRQF